MAKIEGEKELEQLMNQRMKLTSKLQTMAKNITEEGRKKVLKAIGDLDKKLDKHKETYLAEGKIKVKFLKSPTAMFNLGYSIGEVGELEASLAGRVIEAGYGEKVK